MRLDYSTFEVISGRRASKAKDPHGNRKYELFHKPPVLGWTLAPSASNGGGVAVSHSAMQSIEESAAEPP